MAIRERFEYVVDLTTDNAQRGIRNIESAFRNAEGPVNRFKAAGAAALTEVRANAVQFAAIAGAALAAFGARSVQVFQDSAIEAGKFADATGLSTDAASRWIEVGGDIGITGENMRGLFTRLNKAIGDNAPVVAQLGIETQRLADGTVDVNGTMLQAIERLNQIRNPTERAAAAQRLFGRNYAETAELIFGSASELRAELEGVSDAIAIDDREREKAERLRAAMDELGDALKEVQLLFGEELAPQVTETIGLMMDLKSAVEQVSDAVPGFGRLGDAVADILNPVGFFADRIREVKTRTDDLIDSEKELTDLVDVVNDSIAESATVTDDASVATAQYDDRVEGVTRAKENEAAATARLREEQQRNIQSTDRLTDEYNDQRRAIDDLIGKKNALIGGDIAVRQAQRDARDAAAELNTVLAEQGGDLDAVGAALDNTAGSYVNAAQVAADFRADQLEANGSLVDGKVRAQLLKEELSNLAAGVDGPLRAAIQRYIDDLNRIPRSVNTVVTANGTPGSVPIVPGSRYASGTQSAKAGVALVGEQGPELVELKGGERIYNARETGQILGNESAPMAMGGVYVAPGGIVLQGTNMTGEDVVRALDNYVRRGGQLPADVRRRFSA